MSGSRNASPLFATASPPGEGWSGEIRREARRLGTPFMPWQKQAADLVGARRENGLPRYELIIVSVPRQSGKTAFSFAATTARAKQEPMLRLYGTAQTRVDASRHLEQMGLVQGDEAVTRFGVGNERITWGNGSKYELISPTATGGHGSSIDWLVIDEVWAILPHVMAGVVPALAARPHAQILAISTMGTPESEVWNQLVARGRESVDDPDAKIAYLEFAAPDDASVFAEDLWWTWMPALGRTISMDSVRAARDTLPPNEFIRAFGNRMTTVVNSVFPAEWVDRAWRTIQPADQITLAVDVNDEPAGATVSSAHLTDGGQIAVRVLEWRYGGPGWVASLVGRIIQERSVEAVALDAGGPARQVMGELSSLCDAQGVALVDRKPRDLAADTGKFYDALREGVVVLEKSSELGQAITGAYRKDLADLWLVSRRRMTVDASPLISGILAYGMARELQASPRVSAAKFYSDLA